MSIQTKPEAKASEHAPQINLEAFIGNNEKEYYLDWLLSNMSEKSKINLFKNYIAMLEECHPAIALLPVEYVQTPEEVTQDKRQYRMHKRRLGEG